MKRNDRKSAVLTPHSSSVPSGPPAGGPLDAGVWQWLTGPHHRTLFHPTSGLWILGLDWLLFSGNAVSMGFATLLMMVFGFVLGTVGTAFCQRHFAGGSLGKCLAKGLFGGLIVGAPLPIAGTFAGGIIIGLSGLSTLKNRLPFGNR